MCAAYDPRSGVDAATREQEIRERLQIISDAWEQFQTTHTNQETHLVLLADFNRHHVLWGGQRVLCSLDRNNDARDIVDFMSQYGLQSLLRRGTITWQHQSGQIESTPDLVLASGDLASRCEYCRIAETDHGSDHRPIESRFELKLDASPSKPRRRQYRIADWNAARAEIDTALRGSNMKNTWMGESRGWVQAATISPFANLNSAQRLDVAAQELERIVNRALEKHTPRSRPSPFVKRWWTPALTELRQTMTQLRNKVTTARRRGGDLAALQTRHRAAQQMYFDAIDTAKRTHWNDFLADPANVWKANAYTKPDSAATKVPTLIADGREISTDDEKAALLLKTFFPVPPERQDQCNTPLSDKTPEVETFAPLTAYEVKEAIWANRPRQSRRVRRDHI